MPFSVYHIRRVKTGDTETKTKVDRRCVKLPQGMKNKPTNALGLIDTGLYPKEISSPRWETQTLKLKGAGESPRGF